MVKTVGLLTKRRDLSSEEFHHHWREVHGPLVLKLPGVCQYVQCRPVPIHDQPPSFDGVAEVWYEDLGAVQRAFASPAHAAVRADEANFMELADRRISLLGRRRRCSKTDGAAPHVVEALMSSGADSTQTSPHEDSVTVPPAVADTQSTPLDSLWLGARG